MKIIIVILFAKRIYRMNTNIRVRLSRIVPPPHPQPENQ